jgi:hypothetical protein
MRERAERARGVTLRLLDLSGIEEVALERYNQHLAIDGKEPATAMRVGSDPYAVIEKDGTMYVVCNEGVGWEITDEHPLEIDLYPHRDKDGKQSFSIFPAMSASLKPEDVRDRTTETEVDLADHIRTFGARLESNFNEWYRALA